MNKTKKIVAVLLAALIVLAMVPAGMLTAFAANEVYGLCTDGNDGYEFYSCDSTGVSTGQEVDPETITDLFVDGETIGYFDAFIVEDRTVLKSVKFLSGVEEIYSYAFYGFKNLASVDFGDTVQEIGNYAFRETALTSVTLPASLTYTVKKAMSSLIAQAAKS